MGRYIALTGKGKRQVRLQLMNSVQCLRTLRWCEYNIHQFNEGKNS